MKVIITIFLFFTLVGCFVPEREPSLEYTIAKLYLIKKVEKGFLLYYEDGMRREPIFCRDTAFMNLKIGCYFYVPMNK